MRQIRLAGTRFQPSSWRVRVGDAGETRVAQPEQATWQWRAGEDSPTGSPARAVGADSAADPPAAPAGALQKVVADPGADSLPPVAVAKPEMAGGFSPGTELCTCCIKSGEGPSKEGCASLEILFCKGKLFELLAISVNVDVVPLIRVGGFFR